MRRASKIFYKKGLTQKRRKNIANSEVHLAPCGAHNIQNSFSEGFFFILSKKKIPSFRRCSSHTTLRSERPGKTATEKKRGRCDDDDLAH